MAEKPQSAPQSTPSAPASRRSGQFRGGEDPMIELTERARIISQEAGTKVSSAMRDVIGAAAGIAGFAVESARDLVQYMVRRGQMTQEEADKLIREAEAQHQKRPKAERERLAAARIAAEKAAAEKKAARLAAETALPLHRPLSKTVKTPPPLLKNHEAPKVLDKPVAKGIEKPVAKAAAPAKAAPVKAAPVKAAPAKAAPVKAVAKKAAPAKKAAKAPAKASAKKGTKKKR
jgi:polyhydroxyalkanoate synthesis regulator phasin